MREIPHNLDNSPQAISSLLRDRGLSLKKRWGQNFLVEPAARQRLVRMIGARSSEHVWEVGPGLGALTAGLLETGASVTVFEIDHGLIEFLRERFEGYSRLTVVPGDVLRTLHGAKQERGAPDCIAGNLPYRNAASIVGAAIEREVLPSRMVFTVQKEVAERMRALPGEPEYGPLAVLLRSAYQLTETNSLSSRSFFPPPRVDSMALRLERLEEADPLVGRSARVLRALFRRPRKTLWNNLRKLVVEELAGEHRARDGGGETPAADGRSVGDIEALCRSLAVDPGARPAEVSEPALRALARRLAASPDDRQR